MIIVILVVGLVWRLINLNQSLWLDEAIMVDLINSSSVVEVLTKRAWYDLHPPGYHLLMWVWTQLFGLSEISLRLPSVLLGVVTIWLVYLIGRLIFKRWVGLVAAWLLAINPLHLYYSQEGRMYSLATFAVTLNLYYFFRLLLGKGGRVGLMISTLLVLMADYVAYFTFAAQLLILLVWYRTKIRSWLIGFLPGAIAWLCWLPLFWQQAQLGLSSANQLPVWQKVVGSFEIKALVLTPIKFMIGRISFDNQLVYGGVVLVSGGLHLLLVVKALLWRQRLLWIMAIMAVVPLVAAWLASMILPIFSYFRVIFCLPALMVVLGVGLERLGRWRYLVLVTISAIYLICGLIYQTTPAFQRENWRGMVDFLVTQRQSRSLVVLETNGSFSPYRYYAKDQLVTVPSLKRLPAQTVDDIQLNPEMLASVETVFLVDYLVEVMDPDRLVAQKLNQLGWREIQLYDFAGVGFVRRYQHD